MKKIILISSVLLLARFPLKADTNKDNELYTNQMHYNIDAVLIGSFAGFATTANLLKQSHMEDQTRLFLSTLAGLSGGLTGYFLVQGKYFKINRSTAKFLFPLIDTFIYGILGFYTGAVIGETISPQGQQDLPAGAILGALAGGLIGAPTGGILGYKMVVNF